MVDRTGWEQLEAMALAPGDLVTLEDMEPIMPCIFVGGRHGRGAVKWEMSYFITPSGGLVLRWPWECAMLISRCPDG